jgi:parallel beta-helix repeat protein
VTVRDLAFEKQANAGISIFGASNRYILIENCTFSGQYNYGVYDKGKYNEVSNCSLRDLGGIGVMVSGTGSNCTIHHNTLRNIGPTRNGGIGTEINNTAIKCAFVDSCWIHHNNIDSTGYCGISADGGYHLVERNVIRNAMLLNNDGGGLKSYGALSHHITFRNNFVSTSDGTTEGAHNATFVTPAIYFDFNVNNCLVTQNTVFDRTEMGIWQNSGDYNNTITENIVFGCSYGIDLNSTPAQPTPITGMVVKHNVLFTFSPTGIMFRQFALNLASAASQGVIDSNYYFQPYNSESYVERVIAGTTTLFSFPEWQITSVYDDHTVPSFVSWTLPQNDAELFMNPSDNDSTIDLGFTRYLDLDSNMVCGSILLSPYTSKVLIRTGDTCYQPVPITLALTDETLSVEDSACYNALQWLTVAGDGSFVNVESGAVVNFIAGERISFLPGTTIQEGSQVTARITLTEDYCPGYMVMPEVMAVEHAIQEQVGSVFTLIPNPSKGIFTLKYNGEGSGGVKEAGIYTLTGQKAWEGKLPDEKQKHIALPWLKPGLYIMVIRTGSSVESLKLVVGE